jgi:hypothetical protein
MKQISFSSSVVSDLPCIGWECYGDRWLYHNVLSGDDGLAVLCVSYLPSSLQALPLLDVDRLGVRGLGIGVA